MARSGRKLESMEDYQRALRNKYGLGEGMEYKPWLRVQDVKSHGIRHNIFERKTYRVHEFLSNVEHDLFLLTEFAHNVIDLREQFPLFPITMTQRIASHLGVEHPSHPITKQPIVMTTDLLLTTNSSRPYLAISVKKNIKSLDKKICAKLEIERHFWQLLGVEFRIFIENELSRIKAENINWATSPFRGEYNEIPKYIILESLSKLQIGKVEIKGLCDRFITSNLVSHDEALNLLKILIADRYIEVDLSYNIPEAGLLNIISITNFDTGRLYANN